jgi:hypothetical protein
MISRRKGFWVTVNTFRTSQASPSWGAIRLVPLKSHSHGLLVVRLRYFFIYNLFHFVDSLAPGIRRASGSLLQGQLVTSFIDLV